MQKALVDIFKEYDKEDAESRKSQLRAWKENEEFWKGVQYIFWNARDETWTSPDNLDEEAVDEGSEISGSFYDHVINIFRGHGEAIIAAMSSQIPSLRFLPDDADDPDDIATAKTFDKICDLIQRHNKTKLLALKAFFFLYLNGIVASYIYKDSDFNYGVYQVPDFGVEKQAVTKQACPSCGADIPEGLGDLETIKCPVCNEEVKPKVEQSEEEVPVQIGMKDLPKTRVRIDLFGGLQVKIPRWVRSQEECPYLILYTRIPKEVAIDIYEDLEDEIEADHIENFDMYPRAEEAYASDGDPKNIVAVDKIWMRPVAFNKIKDKAMRARVKKKFPKGCRLDIVCKERHFAGAVEEELDKRWKIGQAGLSTLIHSDPTCKPLMPIQKMRNTLANLTIETIEHGISSTFADPRVLNFDEYGKFEAVPGYVYETLPGKPNGKISEGFYETAKATLSGEVPVFKKQLDEDAQFALGSFPSIYGGPSQKDRATLGEYNASRQIALQRLQISWCFFVDWFKNTMESATRLYTEVVVEDEKFVKSKDNTYINVWIRKSEMNGKVGGCESEADSTFPVSLGQKKSFIMELMEMNSPFINAALTLPENADEIQKIFAMTELKLPGADQRMKQVIENKLLMKAEPISDGIPSIQIDPDIDDDPIHIMACKDLLVSTEGMDLKETNPAAYMNVVFHMKLHMMNVQMKTAMQNQTPPGVPPETAKVGGDIQ